MGRYERKEEAHRSCPELPHQPQNGESPKWARGEPWPEEGCPHVLWMVFRDKTTATSNGHYKSLLQGLHDHKAPEQAVHTCSPPRTEEWASRARGGHSGKCPRSGGVATQTEEEKMQEAHCIRPYAGFVSHILSSLERANERSKGQKSISKRCKMGVWTMA